MKRILALILSVVLMLGIAVPAYAIGDENIDSGGCLLYTSPSPRDTR